MSIDPEQVEEPTRRKAPRLRSVPLAPAVSCASTVPNRIESRMLTAEESTLAVPLAPIPGQGSEPLRRSWSPSTEAPRV